MAVRKVSANFWVFCVVCLVATSVVQLSEGSDERCPNKEELEQMFANVSTSWEVGACPTPQKQICVNSSEDSTFTTTTTTTTSDTTSDTSMSMQEDSSPNGGNATKVSVLCAFCPQGFYVSKDSDSDTTTSSSENTTTTPVDSSTSGTASSPTTASTASSSPDTTASSVQTTGMRYRCQPCTRDVRDVACPSPSQDDPNKSKYIIIGASVGGGVLLIIIIVITVVCCRQKRCCCQRRRERSEPAFLQAPHSGLNKDPENVEDDSRNKRKGRYTPMPGSQGPHSSNHEESEVDNLPMAPPPPTEKSKSKRFSVKIQKLPWKRSTKKGKEEAEEKKEGAGYITMNNIVPSRVSSPASDPIYQNAEEAMAGGTTVEEIYQNDEEQEIYENQAMEDDQEIYENEEAIQASGGQLPRQPAPAAAVVVGGEEVYYNVADEDYENPDGRRK